MRDLINIVEAVAYHGSARDFEIFSVDHIGSGDGANTYGWGIYLSSSKSVARKYRKRGEGKLFEIEMPEWDEFLDWKKTFNEQPALVQSALLKLHYPDMIQTMIDEHEWSAGYDYRSETGEDIYSVFCNLAEDSPSGKLQGEEFLTAYREFKKNVSLRLLKAGIAGIRYLDVVENRGDYNYVIFDPRRIHIRKKS